MQRTRSNGRSRPAIWQTTPTESPWKVCTPSTAPPQLPALKSAGGTAASVGLASQGRAHKLKDTRPFWGSPMPNVAHLIAVAVLVFGCSSAANCAAPEKRVALVIGNAAYTGISPLKKPINDAQRMVDVLRSMKFEVILGTDVTKPGMEDMAQKFRAAVKGADVGFFFYSGHGFQTNRVDQQHPVNHLVPVDFKVQEGDVLPTTLALDVVVDTLRREARVGFVFVDACRSDPVLTAASARLANGTRAVTITRGFSPVNVEIQQMPAAKKGPPKGPMGLLIAYATDPGNVAFEGDSGDLSPFTGALVKHLSTPGLSAAEIMGLVSADVALQTKGEQTPWNVSSLTAGTYRFVTAPPQSPTASLPNKGSASPGARPSGGGGSRLPPNVGGGVGLGL